MRRVSLQGFNPVQWPWRYRLLTLAVFSIVVPSIFLRTSSSLRAEDQKTPLKEGVSSPGIDPATAFAQLSVDAALARQSRTLAQATARYSLKAGRPPPPNFDKWFGFAQKNRCLIDDYDQIQRDFEPFYQLATKQPMYFQQMIQKAQSMILKEAMGLSISRQQAIGLTAIVIKDGKLHMPPYRGTTYSDDLPYTLRRFSSILPDVQFVLNGRDEPRVVFNFREPDARNTATKLKDTHPFHLAPHRTDEFFRNQSGCALLSKARGFVSDESGNVAFLRSSSSSDFTTDLWPLLSMTKLSPCFSDILFPGPYYYYASRASPKMRPNDIAWSDKQSQLYWRGSSNGGHIIGDNYHSFPRFRLIIFAREHPEFINAKMTRFENGHCTDQCDRDRIISEYNITGPRDPKKNVFKYRYLLDVDGNTFSGRFLSLLRSGSLVFKSTVFEEYFNDLIRPYEHYIPVKPDLSDLIQKVQWAMTHDDEAHRIQETGRLFAQRVMTDSQNDCYFALLLLEWARLQNYPSTGNATT
ncbi:glycosyl transferase family 90-domain-containing protein [Mycena crocata]|nr:glycosyl transferase family 90-domain-containing protein [Mycena crocata]